MLFTDALQPFTEESGASPYRELVESAFREGIDPMPSSDECSKYHLMSVKRTSKTQLIDLYGSLEAGVKNTVDGHQKRQPVDESSHWFAWLLLRTGDVIFVQCNDRWTAWSQLNGENTVFQESHDWNTTGRQSCICSEPIHELTFEVIRNWCVRGLSLLIRLIR